MSAGANNRVAYIMDRKTQGAEMRKLQERMAAGEFEDDELAAMLETHATIISTGDVSAPNNLGTSSVSKSKSMKDDLEISMELNRQLRAMEDRLDAASPLEEFQPMNRPTGSAKKAGAGAAVKGPKGKGRMGGVTSLLKGGGRGPASPVVGSSGFSPAPGRGGSGSISSSRKQAGTPVSQPRNFRPERSNRTYTAEEQIKMRRDNVSLLSNLERIQRRGGGTDNRPKKKVNHIAAASINRFKGQRNIANENMAFLKRLQSVKSSGIAGASRRQGGGRKTAGAAPPRRGGSKPKKPKGKPEWVDLPVGPMPRV